MEIAKIILEYLKILIWPFVVVLIFFCMRNQIIRLFNIIRKVDLPGGISLETFPGQIEEAKELSEQVKKENMEDKKHKNIPSIPLTEANTKMINYNLSPSPSGLELTRYRNIAHEDANVALAGLRIEVEIMLQNLAKGFNVQIEQRDSAGIIARKLRERGAITSRQAELLNSIIKLCNSAVHGYKVSLSEAEIILDVAEILRDQYIHWLSWGFPKNN